MMSTNLPTMTKTIIKTINDSATISLKNALFNDDIVQFQSILKHHLGKQYEPAKAAFDASESANESVGVLPNTVPNDLDKELDNWFEGVIYRRNKVPELDDCVKEALKRKIGRAVTDPLLIRRMKGYRTSHQPVWLMRQAGRYLPEYHSTKERNGTTMEFFESCNTPEVACEITIQPLRRFKMDAVILFSDILVIPQALGMDVQMIPDQGPYFPDPITDPIKIDEIAYDPNYLNNVYDTLGLICGQLRKENYTDTTVIGFAGAPWTLLTYMLGDTTKDKNVSRKWLVQYPEASKKLMTLLTDSIIDYLDKQINAGANTVQLFDSWANSLSPDLFAQFVIPYITKIGNELKKCHPDTILILFEKGVSPTLLTSLPFDVFGIDYTADATTVRRDVGEHVYLQGNLDPPDLYDTSNNIRLKTLAMMDALGENTIANLGHGIIKDTGVSAVGCFVDAAHSWKKQ